MAAYKHSIQIVTPRLILLCSTQIVAEGVKDLRSLATLHPLSHSLQRNFEYALISRYAAFGVLNGMDDSCQATDLVICRWISCMKVMGAREEESQGNEGLRIETGKASRGEIKQQS